MKPAHLFLMLLLPLLWQCNRSTFSSGNFPEHYLEFGKGGGMTGEVTSYYLLPNGQVFTYSSLAKDTLAYGKLSKRSSEALLTQFSAEGLDSMSFKHPGNVYSFLRQHSAEGVHELVWGSNKMTTPPAAKSYYQSLMTALGTVKTSE